MSDDGSSRKRVAEKQGSRDDCGRDDDEFITTPQVASAEVLATRRIVSVRKPEGSAPPSPFGSVLGSFAPKLPTSVPATAVAPSPFAAFGGAAPPPASPSGGFGSGFNFGITPKPSDAAAAAPAAPAAPTPVGGFNFSFGAAAGGTAAAPKFDFGAAVSAFSAAAASAKQQVPTDSAAAPADDADEDPEAEVPIAAAGGAPTLAAVEVKTGEEGDRVLFEAAAAKLFEFASGDDSDKKSWHERGAGALKVSTKSDGSTTRLVMRDAKLKKVLLNCAVVKNSFRLAQKQEKMFSFSAPVSESTVATYLVKITGPKATEEVKGCLEVLEKVLA